ncbi:unnamed protein product, partial [Aphanomyces euteiches]
SAEAVEYIVTQGRKRWPDFAQFPNLLYKKDLLAITMDPSLPPKAQLQLSWSFLKWMQKKAKIRKQEVEEIVKSVEAGFHLERTGHSRSLTILIESSKCPSGCERNSQRTLTLWVSGLVYPGVPWSWIKRTDPSLWAQTLANWEVGWSNDV